MSYVPESAWMRDRRIDEEDYLTFGEPAPWWDVADEEFDRQDRRARYHDFIFRAPVRESDDWMDLAA